MILGLACIKAMLFFRLSKGFAKMIRISGRVFIDATPFTMFFVFWVFLFGLMFIILGNTYGNDADHPIDANAYSRLGWSTGMILYSWGTAIGDLNAPNGMIWDNPKLVKNDDRFNKT